MTSDPTPGADPATGATDTASACAGYSIELGRLSPATITRLAELAQLLRSRRARRAARCCLCRRRPREIYPAVYEFTDGAPPYVDLQCERCARDPVLPLMTKRGFLDTVPSRETASA